MKQKRERSGKDRPNGSHISTSGEHTLKFSLSGGFLERLLCNMCTGDCLFFFFFYHL